MKYIVPKSKIQMLVNRYFDSFEFTIDDLGDDWVVWDAKSGERMFDTFEDNLAIEEGLYTTMNDLFQVEDIGTYILNWFNQHFDKNLDSYSDISHQDDDEEDDDEYYNNGLFH